MTNKILLVCPSNICYMPYVEHYVEVLNGLGRKYTIVYWDRFNLDENSDWFRYVDGKVGHKRGVLDYVGFSGFIKTHCKENGYDRIVLFGVQLAFFLSSFLIDKYAGKYVWDIRDYHLLLKFFNAKEFLRLSSFTAVSSPGYQEWLPERGRIQVCHNVSDNVQASAPECSPLSFSPLVLSYVGALRDFEIQFEILKEFGGKNDVRLEFHGRGLANDRIVATVASRGIDNVVITGHFDPKDELSLYGRASITNAVIPRAGRNNISLLPNRLYRSVLHQRPLFSLAGTRTAHEIEKYNLGLVVNSIEGAGRTLREYVDKFDFSRFAVDCANFMDDVNSENSKFKSMFIDFIG